MTRSELSNRQVLVTGGAGFIGSHLVDALVATAARVRVLDNFVTGRPENLGQSGREIELVEGDIRDLELCRRACAGVEVVFHQAALGSVPRSLAHPAETMAVNVAGFANVLEAARDGGARRVVYASSSSVYGDSATLPKREGEEGEPLSPYAWSKRMNEQLADAMAVAGGPPSIGLRYFNVYGPRQDPSGPYAAVVPLFFDACLSGGETLIHGDGGQSRDFTFVADAVAANLAAAVAPAAADGAAYNVAAGRATTVLELVEAVRRLVGGGREPVFGPPRPGDVRHSMADPSLARDGLGFDARVELHEGLRRSFDYYASQSERRSESRVRTDSGE